VKMAIQERLEKLRETGPRAMNFLSEVVAEMRKVHWPTRKETYAATVVVIAVTVVIAVFLGVVDFLISYVVQKVLS